MPRIHVCSVKNLAPTAIETGASHVLTLIKNISMVPVLPSIGAGKHLKLDFSDITEPREGEVPPLPEHVEKIIEFATNWDRAAPMIVHCYAGVSRSTAGAFIATCLLKPDWDEGEIAQLIRNASPTATPNSRMIAFAEEIMGRDGRMVAAIAAIGRGEDCFEGVPFHIEIG